MLGMTFDELWVELDFKWDEYYTNLDKELEKKKPEE